LYLRQKCNCSRAGDVIRDEREVSITQRERQLWERQERMYEREMARWDQERQYWHQREAMLLQHISKLHTGLLTLAQLQAKQLPALEGKNFWSALLRLRLNARYYSRDDLQHYMTAIDRKNESY
jgi:hypothetical protein